MVKQFDSNSSMEDEGYAEEWEEHTKSNETGKFELQGMYAFVTYNRSRVTDADKFFEYLQKSIRPRMCYLRPGETAGVRFFGAQELHATGEPHYHVLMAFEKVVHWRDARAKLAVTIEVEKEDGTKVEEVDTLSIRVKTRKSNEPVSWFLDCCQAYICKEGNDKVFGAWIETRQDAGASENTRAARQLLLETDRDKCEEMLQMHFPLKYIFQYPRAWLDTKNGRKAVKHNSKFSGWRVPKVLQQWVRENIVNPVEGRPKSLLLVGLPRTGKTEWAMSFGKPVSMTHGWSMDAFRTGCTHAVLNDIDINVFPYWREFLGCQEEFVVTGKWIQEKTVVFGKPTIWTCNADNDPRHVKVVKEYLEEAGVVVVNVTRPLFRRKRFKLEEGGVGGSPPCERSEPT